MLDNLTHYICRNQADCFVLATKEGYESESFFNFFMNSFTAEKMDGLYDRTQWMGPEWLLSEIELEARQNGVTLLKGEEVSSNAMHWIGYMCRYWNRAREISSAEIVRRMDFRTLFDISYGMHTISFEEALERLDPKNAKIIVSM